MIERATLLAEEITQTEKPGEESYLTRISALIKHRQTTPTPLFNLARPIASHEAIRRHPFIVLQFRMAPGATIPHHDHREFNGVLTVTEGTIRSRSYEILGSDPRPPRGSVFQVRETDERLLSVGDQAMLSRTRDNIHELKAGPEGAQFIDFFTLFGEDAHSAFIDFGSQSEDFAGAVFDATWV